jgi:putative NADPH-quinone reductase
MNVLIVLAHPEPKSMNGALADAACETLAAAGHSVAFSDLHAMAFDPRSTRANFTSISDADFFKPQAEERHASETGGFTAMLDAEMDKLEACDLMIWQFPLWWFSLPASLKGWVDRVFAAGRIYGGERIFEGGVKRGSRAMLSLTTGGRPAAYLPGGSMGDIMAMLKPIHRGMLEFIGFEVLAPNIVYAPARLGDDERKHELAKWRERLLAIEREASIDVGRY